MGAAEETRQVIHDFLALGLREMRSQLAAVNKRLDAIEDANRIRHESVVQRLEFVQQSFAFDKRLSAIEEDKRRSA